VEASGWVEKDERALSFFDQGVSAFLPADPVASAAFGEGRSVIIDRNCSETRRETGETGVKSQNSTFC
jgi:hypothetical protein